MKCINLTNSKFVHGDNYMKVHKHNYLENKLEIFVYNNPMVENGNFTFYEKKKCFTCNKSLLTKKSWKTWSARGALRINKHGV